MDKEIRATCKILESIASSYPPGSAERAAVEQAAQAFIYVRLHKELRESYETYRRICAKPLTQTQIEVLKKMDVSV